MAKNEKARAGEAGADAAASGKAAKKSTNGAKKNATSKKRPSVTSAASSSTTTSTAKKASSKKAPTSTAKASTPKASATASTASATKTSAGTTTRSESAPKKAASNKATSKKTTSKKAAPEKVVSVTTASTKKNASVARTAGTSKARTAKEPSSKARASQHNTAGVLAEAVEMVATVGKDKATKKETKKHKALESDFTSALKVTPGFSLAEHDAGSTPAFDAGPKKAEKLMRKTGEELADLQERLYAGQRHPGGRSALLLVQGMDTSGKGGIMRHVVGTLDPQGVELTSFKAPTPEEQKHPFLWRIRNALPKPGYVGVFDRSQYEDVLIVRVHDLVSRPVWMRRYGQINAFEKSVVAGGTTLIKVMLHIDADEQKARLAERLDDPEKFYKFNPGDLKEREYWADYLEAYQAVLERTSTDYAPWFVVPANNKWYARLAVQQLLLEHLRAMDLQWPEATFDVEAQKAALEAL